MYLVPLHIYTYVRIYTQKEFEKRRLWDADTDWIDLAQERKKWLVLVNAVMNFRFL